MIVHFGRRRGRHALKYTHAMQDQVNFCPTAPWEISVLPELALGHLCYRLTGVPLQSNSPPATVPGVGKGLVLQNLPIKLLNASLW